MNKRTCIALAGAAGLLGAMAASGAAQASANPPYFITSGTTSSGTTGYSASTVDLAPSPDILFYTDFVDMSCDAGQANGTINLGSDADGLAIGTVETTTSDWDGCIGPLGLDMVVHPTASWDLNVEGPAGGVTDGSISNVSATVVAINPTTGSEDPTLCSFDVVGEAVGHFDESDQTLHVEHTPANAATDQLQITSFQGCAGQVEVGDDAYFEAVYDVDAALGALDIS
jgi:hypothetical protein